MVEFYRGDRILHNGISRGVRLRCRLTWCGFAGKFGAGRRFGTARGGVGRRMGENQGGDAGRRDGGIPRGRVKANLVKCRVGGWTGIPDGLSSWGKGR